MSVPRIEELRLENWLNLSADERKGALQDLEDALAEQEHRSPSKVDFISNCGDLSPEERQDTLGLHSGNNIYVNDALLEGHTTPPYEATNTLFHEARHAYQKHVVAHPEQAEDLYQVRDWQMNTTDGYLSHGKFGYPVYRWQPIEKDANDIARQRMEELYTEQFADNSSLYKNYNQRVQAELETDIGLGRRFVASPRGADNYVEHARQKMIDRYQQETLSQVVGEGPGQAAGSAVSGPAGSAVGEAADEGVHQTAELAAETSGQSVEAPTESLRAVANESPSTAAEPDQDYDYSQGLGL